MNLSEMRRDYEQRSGYSRLNATARVCQDVILSKLAALSMKEHITIKGGILMCSLSGSKRRATQDIDLDFVRYSISDDSVKLFFRKLSDVDDGISIKMVGPIEELSQQDYKGKRVHIQLSDGKSSFQSKVDIGVNASLELEQVECIFDICQDDEGVCLLANSMEQIFAEKLKSLLKHGIRSTRYRDIYDMYYLGHRDDIDKEKLISYINLLVIDDRDMWDRDIEGAIRRIRKTFEDITFIQNMRTSRRDWIGKSVPEVTAWLLNYLNTLS